MISLASLRKNLGKTFLAKDGTKAGRSLCGYCGHRLAQHRRETLPDETIIRCDTCPDVLPTRAGTCIAWKH